MKENDTRLIPKSAYLLLPVMALAFYLAFIPHQGYPYPLHVDEWLHMAFAKALLKAGSTTFALPLQGTSTVTLSGNLEAGFHVFWGIFQRISGLSWLTIFRYFPGVILVFTVLAVYALGDRMGFGWEAALFTALIPTTVGILGPAFLVPVSLGLLFVALSMFVALNFRSAGGYLVLFIFTGFLLSIHAPSAIALVLILIPYILLNLKGNFKHALGIALALAVPFLAPFPWIFRMLLPTAIRLLTPQVLPDYVAFPRVIISYGYVPAALCLLGTLALAWRGGKRNYGLALGLLALLLMLVTFFSFHYGVSIVYERGLMFMMMMVAVLAGAGLATVRNLRLPEALSFVKVREAAVRYAGWGLCLVLVGITLYAAIPDRQDIPYYHMIDDEDYQAFVWIQENLGQEYNRAILDPWRATAFNAITGKEVFSRLHSFPTPRDEAARLFLEDGCEDTAFLRAEGITIVYTDFPCTNPDLTEVRENVFLLRPAGDGG